MAGIKRLQIEAAVITPEAKPVSARWMPSRSCLRMKNTQAEPSIVPAKGINRP